MLLRIASAILIALLVIASLFWFMQWLIIPKGAINTSQTKETMFNFVKLKHKDQDAKQRERELPKPKPKELPKMQTEVAKAKQRAPKNTPKLDMKMPNLQNNFGGFAKGPKIGAPSGSTAPSPIPTMQTDSSLIPLVRINPRYPRRAAKNGIEGSVKVSVMVNSNGEVKSVEILEANPSDIFNRSVKKAVKKWKFKPKIVNGKAIEYSGTTTIDFKLDKS